jgi:hypothetical protein
MLCHGVARSMQIHFTRIQTSRLSVSFGVVALAALTAWALHLRVWQLGAQSLWIDEGFSVVHARAMLEHGGRPQLPGGATDWSAWPFHAVMAAVLRWQPQDGPAAARLPAAVAGALLVPALFAFHQRWFGSRRQAWLAALLMAFLTCEVAWSRQARAYVPLQLLIVSALWAWRRAVDEHRARWLLPAALLAGLAIATHRAGYLALAVAGFELMARAIGRWRSKPEPRPRRPDVIELSVSGEGRDAVYEARPTGPRAIPWAAVAWGACAALVLAVAVGADLWQWMAGAEADDALINWDWGAQAGRHAAIYSRYLHAQLGGLALWAVAGALLGRVAGYPGAVPVALGAALYLAAISVGSPLFHLRYALPVLPLVLSLGLVGIGAVGRVAARRSCLIKLLGLAVLLVGGWNAIVTCPLTPRATAEYRLDYTVPQPDWRGACELVGRLARASAPPEPPVTISTFPMFHDLYLGPEGTRRFLPFSPSGLAGDVQWESVYSAAEPVRSVEELERLRGYVVLDDFSLRMLANGGIRDWLAARPPLGVFKGGAFGRAYVWRLEGGSDASAR